MKYQGKPCKKGHSGVRYAKGNSCVECTILRATAHNKANPEKHNAACRAWSAANMSADSEAKRAWKVAHPEEVRDSKRKTQRTYQKRYPHKINSQVRQRQAEKLRRSPAWANQVEIAKSYELAQFLSQETGYKWHVDHEIPLQGRKVSGLHVENNLQVLPAVMNLRKSNHFEAR